MSVALLLVVMHFDYREILTESVDTRLLQRAMCKSVLKEQGGSYSPSCELLALESQIHISASSHLTCMNCTHDKVRCDTAALYVFNMYCSFCIHDLRSLSHSCSRITDLYKSLVTFVQGVHKVPQPLQPITVQQIDICR